MKRPFAWWTLLPLLAVACGSAVEDAPTSDEIEAARALSCAECSLELCVDGSTPALLRECLEGAPEDDEMAVFTCIDEHAAHEEGAWSRVLACSTDTCSCEDAP